MRKLDEETKRPVQLAALVEKLSGRLGSFLTGRLFVVGRPLIKVGIAKNS
jgi:hypothetical protein